MQQLIYYQMAIFKDRKTGGMDHCIHVNCPPLETSYRNEYSLPVQLAIVQCTIAHYST